MSKGTDAIGISVIVGLVFAAILHLVILIEPNWWYFDYGTWVQDTSGVERLNGGVFRVCQFHRLRMGGEWSCAGYAEGPDGLLNTRDGLHPDSDLLRLWRVFSVGSLLPTAATIALIGFSFRSPYQRKLLLTAIAIGMGVAQTLLMVSSVATAHEFIVQAMCDECDWRDLYQYQWCFTAACVLIGLYLLLALLLLPAYYLIKKFGNVKDADKSSEGGDSSVLSDDEGHTAKDRV